MKKIELLKQFFFGDLREISSEKYFILITTLFASLFLLILCLFHIIEGLSITPVILAASSSLLLIGLFYLIRFHDIVFIPKLILTVGGLIMLDLSWYSKYLSNGPTLYFILIFAALVIWVWNGKQLKVLMAFYFINLAVLFYIDYNSPDYLFEYPNEKIRSIDIFLSFFFYSILLIFLLLVVKLQFIKQSKKLSYINDLYFEMFSNTPIGLYQSTPLGVIINVNQALIKMLEFDSKEDLLQRNSLNDGYKDFTQRKEFAEIVDEIGEITDYESEWITKNGNRVIVLESAKAVYNSRGEIIRLDGTVQDITEKRKIERDLIMAKEKAEESDRLKSAFLSNMSHEIRTPMNSILGFSELLMESNISSTKQDKYHEIVNASGKRLMNLINDIVDISKIDSQELKLNPVIFNLNNLIDQLQEQFLISPKNKNTTIKVVKELQNEHSFVNCDETRMAQVLSNLLENALKYTHNGEVEIGYNVNEDKLHFYVKDTGLGIDKKDHLKIFDRFVQSDNDRLRAKEGSGLGLAISKGIIELFSGEIWVESEFQKGSTFHVTIPNCLVVKEQSELTPEIVENNKNTVIKTILVAEDEESNFWFIEAALEDEPFHLIHVLNGKDAVEVMQNNANIDLILMDFNMPVMNGLDATLAIRKTHPNIPIIALTAYAMMTDKEKALKAGCTDYLSKPISKNVLIETINKYVMTSAII